jgi:hypothetical protein
MRERLPEITIDGHSVKRSPRVLSLMQGQPGEVAVTIYAAGKSITVLVPDKALRSAMEILAVQQKNRWKKREDVK